jgi:hypothetical protein
MRIDWYTKGVLTVIAVLLAMIVAKQYVSPDTVVRADGPFAGVEFTGLNGGVSFFDTKTGEIVEYVDAGNAFNKLRLTKLGAPLVKEK